MPLKEGILIHFYRNQLLFIIKQSQSILFINRTEMNSNNTIRLHLCNKLVIYTLINILKEKLQVTLRFLIK